jgi:D-inositol-3-phosphate glycosyltransferase
MNSEHLRVVMVSEHASPLARVGGEDAGGQNVHVAALADALAVLGAEVVVHTRRDDPGLPDRVELTSGVVVEHVDAGPARPVPRDELHPHMRCFAERLHESWTREPPDVVHAHFWMSGEAALDAAEPLGIPVLQTFHALGTVKRRHQGAEDTSPPERLAVERAILSRVSRVLATCSDEARELAALGAPQELVTVIPCGVDLTRFWHEGEIEPRPPGRARILVVGRLVPRKGVREVLHALALVPDVDLVVAGGPDPALLGTDPEARALLDLADELGLRDRVTLRGQVAREHLPALYRSADLVVCAPWYEPFGIVPLEAMGCGVPVVAAAVGGLLDTVVDGVTGLLVPPRRPAALASAITELLADPGRRSRMGAAAARRARLYSWQRIAAATLRAYREVAMGEEALTEAVSQ